MNNTFLLVDRASVRWVVITRIVWPEVRAFPRSGSYLRPHTDLFTRLAEAQIITQITLSTFNVSKVTAKDQNWTLLDSIWTLAKSCSARRV
jgi:hypothetical protein